MHGNPQTLEEAVSLREQQESEGQLKIVRELTALIAMRWPGTQEGRVAQATVDELGRF